MEALPGVMDKNLQNLINSDIIDTTELHQLVNEMNERKRYLKCHDQKIWQGKNGKWYTRLQKDGQLKLIKRTTLKDIEDLVIAYYKEIIEEPTIEKVFNDWINAKYSYGEIKKQTYDKYICEYNRYIKDTKFAKSRVRYINDGMLEDFIKRNIRDYSMTAKQYSGLKTLIRGIFKYSKKNGYTDLSITNFFGDLDLSRRMFRKNIPVDSKQIFTDAEVNQIKRYLMNDNTVVGYGILLTFLTGLRIGELAALRREDIQGDELLIRRVEEHWLDDNGHRVVEVVDGAKTDAGIRNVILTQEARSILKRIVAINPFGEYLFMHDGRRYVSINFTDKLYSVCNILGIEQRSMHKVRKTYATKLINAGVDEKIIQKQMGHTDIATTKKYYYFDNKDKEYKLSVIEKALNF